jgi:predicted PurR-regulated permease PerM
MGEAGTPGAPGTSGASTFQSAKPIALALVIAIFTVIGLRIIAELRDVLVLFFVAVLFASALARPAAVLERRGVRRGPAVGIVQAAALGALVGVLWLVVPPLVSQLALFSDRLPSYVTRFQHSVTSTPPSSASTLARKRSNRRWRAWPVGLPAMSAVSSLTSR